MLAAIFGHGECRGRYALAVSAFVIGSALALAGAAVPGARANADLERAVEILRASDEEWRREDAAYRAALKDGSLQGTGQADYAEFVAGLRVRLLEQCEVVRALGGNNAVRGFECIQLSVSDRRIPLRSTASVQTEEEKQAALASRLSELEGKIDETLLKRQQEMRQAAAAPSGAAASGGGASGSSGAAGATGSQGQSGSAGGSNTGGRPPSGQSASQGQGQGVAIPPGGARPSQAPSSTAGGPSDGRRGAPQSRGDGGNDDDVVARQLREAAERETDPVLKDKLWGEYRKYKEAKR